ncbi:hypothetical protein PsYK624_152480 [Phanerochaete sordida]|uniref:Uncharacterized protein n=1 Tax=Phanerochaete sordida TaxID=48140 RepID=A0A9P3LL44_9APHY|nr:hypothetical protein PsYK624_152480 [Phanerochaete sordida]
MQLTLGFALFATAISLVRNGAASPIANGSLEARKPDFDNSLFVCNNANWNQPCDNVGFYNEQCTVFPSGFQDSISSIGPPQGYYCYAYTDYTCDGDGLGNIVYPGIYDLGDGNTNYNDNLNSFRCYASACCE